MVVDLDTLNVTVQKNCHIADARYAGNYSMCVYLLKMREYFRWEKGLSFGDTLPNGAVGEWLEQRESLWEALQDAPFEPMSLSDRTFDPFETARINQALVPQGLIYSGGLGENAKPHFFLGRLEREEQRAGFKVLISSQEFARDLSAPPAMSLGNTIFIRRESLRRMLWERVESWRWDKPDNALARALSYYDLDRDLEQALEQMTDNELKSVLLHEIGEVRAGELLGAAWNELLAALPRSKAEIMARAVRDHLADCLSTLPVLVQWDEPASVHAYFANLNNMRKAIFPSLGQAYEQWRDHEESSILASAAAQGHEHWLHVAQSMLALYRQHGEGCIPHIEDLVEANYL